MILIFFPKQIYSQQNKQESFTAVEYSINDSSFYNELCAILFSDTIFTAKEPSKYFFAMHYDTSSTYTDFIQKEQKFSANLNIFEIMTGSLFRVTNAGKDVIGFFYINFIPCFILNSTQPDFITEYLTPTDTKREFKLWDFFPIIGGFTDVYLNILSNKKIEIVKVFRYE